jgi:hypothetical protein
MSKSFRVAAAGVMLAALGGTGLIAASPASAAAQYSVKIYHQAAFSADFCIHAQSYDDFRDHTSRCSGDRMVGSSGTLRVDVTDRHRVWLDVWVRAGAAGKQITLHNGFNERANRHVFNTRECTISGTTFDWKLVCDGVEFYKQ